MIWCIFVVFIEMFRWYIFRHSFVTYILFCITHKFTHVGSDIEFSIDKGGNIVDDSVEVSSIIVLGDTLIVICNLVMFDNYLVYEGNIV